MSQTSNIEEGLAFTPKWNADGLIPVIAQDHASGDVLMLAYMNPEALKATLASGEATYWSRSRKSLWKKGETSGHTQKVREILVDCDQDALILKIEQVGGTACHTGRRSCFYRVIERFSGDSAENPKLQFKKSE